MRLESVIEQVSEIKLALQKIFDKARGINELDEGNGIEEGMLSAVYSPSLKKTVKMPYSSVELDEILDSDSETVALNLKGANILSTRDGVHKRYSNHTDLFSNKSEQINSLIYFVQDATDNPIIDRGYAYFEYLGTNNGDWSDYRIISTEEGFEKPRELKLFAKTSSTSSNWSINKINVINETAYRIIDNQDGSTIQEGVFSASVPIVANLSNSSGDSSIFLDLNEDGNSVTLFNNWNNTVAALTYINFDVFPNLKDIQMYFGNITTNVIGSLTNLESFKSYSSNYVGLNFQNTTKMIFFNAYGAINFDIDVNLSNNPNLRGYKNVKYSSTFNTANHPQIESLEFKNNGVLDSNINTNNLPSLKKLVLYDKITTLDCSVNNLSSLEYLNICCDNLLNQHLLTGLKELYLKCEQNTSLPFTGMTNLTKLVITNITNVVGVLDLKPLISLKHFQLDYTYHSNITEIDIANGLNSYITKFRRYYVNQGTTLNVKVDNPVNANNGVSPYLSSVWEKQYNGYDVLNFI